MTPPKAAQPATEPSMGGRQRTISLFNYVLPKTAARPGRVVVLLLAVIVVAVFGAWMLVGRGGA